MSAFTHSHDPAPSLGTRIDYRQMPTAASLTLKPYILFLPGLGHRCAPGADTTFRLRRRFFGLECSLVLRPSMLAATAQPTKQSHQ